MDEPQDQGNQLATFDPVVRAIQATEPDATVKGWSLDDQPKPDVALSRMQDLLRTHAVADRPYHETVANFQRYYPGVDPPTHDEYQKWSQRATLETKLEDARAKAQSEPLPGGSIGLRRAVAFPRDLITAGYYASANSSYKKGTATDQELRDMALYEEEQRQRGRGDETWGGYLGNRLAELPSHAAGLFIGGAVAEAATPAALATATGLKAAAGRAAIQAAVTPNVGLQAAFHNNTAAGREPFDVRGLASGEALGLAQMLVLHGTGRLTEAAIAKAGLSPSYAANVLGQGLAGPIAQGATDIVTGVLGLSTGYGNVENVLKSDADTALKHALNDALTFAAFRALQGQPEQGRAVAEVAARAASQARRDGLSAEGAAGRVQQAVLPLKQAAAKAPQATSKTPEPQPQPPAEPEVPQITQPEQTQTPPVAINGPPGPTGPPAGPNVAPEAPPLPQGQPAAAPPQPPATVEPLDTPAKILDALKQSVPQGFRVVTSATDQGTVRVTYDKDGPYLIVPERRLADWSKLDPDFQQAKIYEEVHHAQRGGVQDAVKDRQGWEALPAEVRQAVQGTRTKRLAPSVAFAEFERMRDQLAEQGHITEWHIESKRARAEAAEAAILGTGQVRMAPDQLFDALRERRSVPGLSARQADDLRQHVVEGKTLEEIGRKRGVTKEAVRQSVEKAAEKLHNVVEEPPPPAVAERSVARESRQAAAGELPSRLVSHPQDEQLADALVQYLEDNHRAGITLADDRVEQLAGLLDRLQDGSASASRKRKAVAEAAAFLKSIEGTLPPPVGQPAPVRPDAGPAVLGGPPAGVPAPEGPGPSPQGNAPPAAAPADRAAAGHELAHAYLADLLKTASPWEREKIKEVAADLLGYEAAGQLVPVIGKVVAPKGLSGETVKGHNAQARTGQWKHDLRNHLLSLMAPEEMADVQAAAHAQGLSGTQAQSRARQANLEAQEIARRALEQELRGGPAEGVEAHGPPGGPGGGSADELGHAGPGGATEVEPGVYFHRGAGNQLIGAGTRVPRPPAPRGQPAPAVTQAVVEPPGVGASVLRHRNAERVARMDRDAAAMEEGRRFFQTHIDAEPDPAVKAVRFLKFFSPIEDGQPRNAPADQRAFAGTYRRLKDEYTAALASRDLIESTIQNHVGHLWKDPKNPNATPEEIAGKLAARRPLAGREGFQKRRSLDFLADGLAAGLEPVDWNPMDYARKEFDQYGQSIFAHDARTDFDALGMRKYVRLGGAVPDGLVRTSDKGDTVFAPPETKLKEFFDKKQMDALNRFAAANNIPVTTSTTGPAGMSDPQGVVRRFGTPESVLVHELGHQIADRYQLNAWGQNPSLKAELEALADLRASGQVSPQYQQYLRSPPELVANLFAGYLHAPELTKQTAPNAYQVLDSFLAGHANLAPLRDIKPSLEIGEREQAKRLAGPMLVGHYYYPAEVAKLIDNHVSPGLAGNQGWVGTAYRAFRGVGNQMSQFLLGWSGYHSVATALNAQFTAAAEAMGALTRGEAPTARAGVESLPLVAAFEGVRLGRQMRAEWDQPGSQSPEVQQQVEWLKRAGGRARGGAEYVGNQIAEFTKAVRLIQAGRLGKIPEALARALPALNQLVSKPTMDGLVPLVKMHAFADAAKGEMARMQNLSPAEQNARLGKIWDAMDDRFGLLTYDNLFLNRTVRDSLQASFLSFGWNLGDVRGLGGGLADTFKPSMWQGLSQGQGLSRRTGFLVSMMAGTAIYAALYQLLRTGKGPEEARDLWFPKTGEKNADGTAARVSIPGYTKDLAAVANRATDSPLQVGRNIYKAGAGKLHPAIHLLGDILTNEDWRGAAVDNPNDPYLKQAQADAKHVLDAFVPISVRQLVKPGSAGDKLQGLAGLTPAPYTATHTWQEQRKAEAERKVQLTPLQKLLKGQK